MKTKFLNHRFSPPLTEQEEEESFARSIRKTSVRKFLEKVWSKLLCKTRFHVGNLHYDLVGFYRICDRCGFYQRVELWKMPKRRKRK